MRTTETLARLRTRDASARKPQRSFFRLFVALMLGATALAAAPAASASTSAAPTLKTSCADQVKHQKPSSFSAEDIAQVIKVLCPPPMSGHGVLKSGTERTAAMSAIYMANADQTESGNGNLWAQEMVAPYNYDGFFVATTYYHPEWAPYCRTTHADGVSITRSSSWGACAYVGPTLSYQDLQAGSIDDFTVTGFFKGFPFSADHYINFAFRVSGYYAYSVG